MIRHRPRLSLLVTTVLLSACGVVAVQPDARPPIQSQSGSVASTVGDCRALLERTVIEPADPLTSTGIGLLVWNIKKGSRPYWGQDLHKMARGKDLVVLQETMLDSGVEQQLDGLQHMSFSQGFTTRTRTTGVGTYSKHKPISECRLSVVEPWLRSPKATSITEFALAGRNETLVVVNVHVVNISLGLVRFRDQMEQIRAVMASHDGPTILAGDFNTWRQKRLDIINLIASDLALTAVQVDADYRKTFNGHALDHVFVRGLSVVGSETQQVTSSDHNPITVELQL